MSEATQRPWGLEVTNSALWIGSMRTDGIKVADIVTHLEYGDEYNDTYSAKQRANAELIVHAVNNIDRIAAERDGLRKALETSTNKMGRVVAWLERLAIAAEKQAKDTRFESLAEACVADAKNYRKTMEDLIPVVTEARAALAVPDADKPGV